jgi:hypothetical protein
MLVSSKLEAWLLHLSALRIKVCKEKFKFNRKVTSIYETAQTYIYRPVGQIMKAKMLRVIRIEIKVLQGQRELN